MYKHKNILPQAAKKHMGAILKGSQKENKKEKKEEKAKNHPPAPLNNQFTHLQLNQVKKI